LPLLEVKNLHVAYGSLEAVKGISFHIEPSEMVTILGSNGAGKTTTLRTLTGLIRPAAGEVRFGGTDLASVPPYSLPELGIVLVPEGRQLFPEHTVLENLELGAYHRLRKGERKEFKQDLDFIFELFPRVRERLTQPAGLLSGGEQQMVAVARAFVARPQLLLLDEPSLGLAPKIVEAMFAALRKYREQGITILLVEQMALIGLEFCDRAYVLEAGRIALSGPRDAVISDPGVIEAYLGKSQATAAK
jgi:branched-chain amino acid transport system ATP-binding protein